MHLLLLNAGIATFGYSGHSLRKSAAITADRNGISRHHIKLLGIWKSDAVDVYINERKQSEQIHWLLFLNANSSPQSLTELSGLDGHAISPFFTAASCRNMHLSFGP
jgi:hypothetical protein